MAETNQPVLPSGMIENSGHREGFHERPGNHYDVHLLIVKMPEFYTARTLAPLNSYEDLYNHVLNRHVDTFQPQNDEEFQSIVNYVAGIMGPDSLPVTPERFRQLHKEQRRIIEQSMMGENKVILLPHKSGNRAGYSHFELTSMEHSDRGVGLIWDGKYLRLAEGRFKYFPNENPLAPFHRVNFVPMFEGQNDPSVIDVETILKEYDITDLARYIEQQTTVYYEQVRQENAQNKDGKRRPLIHLEYKDILEGLKTLKYLPSAENQFPSEELENARQSLLWIINDTTEETPLLELTDMAIGQSKVKISTKSEKRKPKMDTDPQVAEMRKKGNITWDEFVNLFPVEIQPYIRKDSTELASRYVPMVKARQEALKAERDAIMTVDIHKQTARRVLAEQYAQQTTQMIEAETYATVDANHYLNAGRALELRDGVAESADNFDMAAELSQARTEERSNAKYKFREQLDAWRQNLREMYAKAGEILFREQGNAEAQALAQTIMKALNSNSPDGQIVIEGSKRQLKLLQQVMNHEEIPQIIDVAPEVQENQIIVYNIKK